jgi:hypothetical protein
MAEATAIDDLGAPAEEKVAPTRKESLMTEVPLRLAARLSLTAEFRALVLQKLAEEDPLALDALDSLERDVATLEDASAALGDHNIQLLMRRIRMDLRDAFDGLLEGHHARILEPSRDLMEVAVLIRDFRREPQRYEKWLTIKEEDRPREFSFGRLLHKYPDEAIYPGADPGALFTEYTMHSRTLHPAAPLTFPIELSRADDIPADLAVPWSAPSVAEILLHGIAALIEAIQWLVKLNSEFNTELEVTSIGENGPAQLWLENYFEWQQREKPEELAALIDEGHGRYAPRRKPRQP